MVSTQLCICSKIIQTNAYTDANKEHNESQSLFHVTVFYTKYVYTRIYHIRMSTLFLNAKNVKKYHII